MGDILNPHNLFILTLTITKIMINYTWNWISGARGETLAHISSVPSHPRQYTYHCCACACLQDACMCYACQNYVNDQLSLLHTPLFYRLQFDFSKATFIIFLPRGLCSAKSVTCSPVWLQNESRLSEKLVSPVFPSEDNMLGRGLLLNGFPLVWL